MSILLLTGPPAAGKNTIAERLAKQRQRCAVIDVDVLRRMAIHPQREPWEGEDGPVQYRLGIDNACAIAHNFARSNYDVVIIDVITDAMLETYKEMLDVTRPWVVQLMPTEEEISVRLLSRPDYLSRGEVSWLYDQQLAFSGYDHKLDNSAMTPETAADWILQRWTKVLA